MKKHTLIWVRVVSVSCALSVFTALVPASAQAYPQLDLLVPTDGLPLKVYRDHDQPDQFWYIPESVEPWTRDGQFKSSLYNDGNALSFIFRGQPSVEPAMIEQVARALGTTTAHFSPVPYEYSKNVFCQNVFGDDPTLKWIFPSRIGNYLEVVPISIRTTNKDLIRELDYHINNGGLACTVEVGFKGEALAYHVSVVADLNQVYDRFELAAHAEALWWEVDIHTLIEHLVSEKIITITAVEDASIPTTDIDKRIQASMDQVTSQIVQQLFATAQRVPDGPMQGRGKPWSLRADYRHSQTNAHWTANLRSDKIQVKDTQIGIRLAIK